MLPKSEREFFSVLWLQTQVTQLWRRAKERDLICSAIILLLEEIYFYSLFRRDEQDPAVRLRRPVFHCG